jgi:hypothetical protein
MEAFHRAHHNAIGVLAAKAWGGHDISHRDPFPVSSLESDLGLYPIPR